MHKGREAWTGKTHSKRVEISNFLSQAFGDTQGSILPCPLEPSCPSTAPSSAAPPTAGPQRGTAFHHLHLPLDFTVLPPKTWKLPDLVVTTRGGHTAEAQMPGLTNPLPATLPGLGLAPGYLLAPERHGQGLLHPGLMGPALSHACSWHSVWADGAE